MDSHDERPPRVVQDIKPDAAGGPISEPLPRTLAEVGALIARDAVTGAVEFTDPATDLTATAPAQRRTPKEVADLKLNWRNDPCWDIEDTEGFEAHREELLAFRYECERKDAEYQERLSREKAQREWDAVKDLTERLDISRDMAALLIRLDHLTRAAQKIADLMEDGR